MSQLDTANLVIPLAESYNTRGQNAFGNTNASIDQRKINSVYRLVRNAITGQMTLYVGKRPGVSYTGSPNGTSGQVAYLIGKSPGANLGSIPWVYSNSSNDVRVSDGSGTTVIFTSAGYLPAYIDKTAISGVENIIMQARKYATGAQRVWFSTAIGSWTEITDSDFAALTIRGKMEPMDGYLFALDNMNRIYNSDVNSLANWTPDNFITKQIRQDVPLGLMRFKNQILACGEKTTEVFVNNGNPSGSPLSTSNDLQAAVGIIDPLQSYAGKTHYYATLENFLYFIGRDGGSEQSMGLFAYNGSTFQRVSTPFIDAMLSSNDPYSVNLVSFQGQNAIAIAMDTTTATTQRWLMFFPTLNEWFEWQSTVFTPVNDGTYFLGVGANQHKTYFIEPNSGTEQWQDDTTNFTTTHQFKLPKPDNAAAIMGWCGVKGDTSRVASALNVSFSDDDWQSVYSAGSIDMTQVGKKHIYQCGRYTDRGVLLTHTANCDLRIESFLARVQ